MLAIRRAAATAALVFAVSMPAGPATAQTAESAGHPARKTAAERQYRIGDILVRQPWTRATPKGAPVAGGFVTIENRGKAADRLVGGSFDLAGRFEIHEMSMSGGIMKMRHLPEGLQIGPGQKLVLKPGGYHLMFMKLKEQIVPGKAVRGTLVFEKAGRVEVEFAAAPIGSKTPPGHRH